MKKRGRRALIGLAGLGLIVTILFVPALPWSARNRHKLSKALASAEITLAELRGDRPTLATLSGCLIGRVARLEILNSIGSWASLTDQQGRFSIPDVLWYPNATYELIITADAYSVRRIKLAAPSALPGDGVFNVGEINFETCEEIDVTGLFGLSSVSYQEYDKSNRDYYQELFKRLIAGKQSDADRMQAICEYVATRRNKNRQWTFDSPRQVIEGGSEYCGNLALAMAAIVESADYKTRRVDVIERTRTNTHVLVEVYYGNKWHLYDPTFGISFRTRFGEVASYKDIRLDSSLIRNDAFQGIKPKVAEWLWEWMPEVYSSGFHHFYYFRKKTDACAA
jgi:Transglutaminase-like superfamily